MRASVRTAGAEQKYGCLRTPCTVGCPCVNAQHGAPGLLHQERPCRSVGMSLHAPLLILACLAGVPHPHELSSLEQTQRPFHTVGTAQPAKWDTNVHEDKITVLEKVVLHM